MQTLDNFKNLERIYIGGKNKRDYRDDAAECSLNPELFKCSYQQSLIPNENQTGIAKRIEEGKRSFETHIPRID